MGLLHGLPLRCLTFELRRDRRYCAWPARRIMYQGASRAKCNAVGPRLERGVRPHSLHERAEFRIACSAAMPAYLSPGRSFGTSLQMAWRSFAVDGSILGS